MIVTLKDNFSINIYEKNTLSWILCALMKINSETNYDLSYFLKKFHFSKDIDLIQRLHEFDLITKFCFIKESQKPMLIDESLSFLDVYVSKFKRLGYKLYDPQRNLKESKSQTEESTKNNNNNNENENKIHFEGKKFWGNTNPASLNNSEKKPVRNRNSFPSIKPPEIINQEKKTEEVKPINMVQTPTEEFASKVFKGILDESRKRKEKFVGISHNHKIEIAQSTDEVLIKLNHHFNREENNVAQKLNELMSNQQLENIELLFSGLNENDEKVIECEILGKEELKRLVDNFSLRLFEKKSTPIEYEFIMAGIKSNEAIVCFGNENFERLKFRFRSSSMVVLTNLIGFVKEYINKKGFEIFEKN